jgi:hypothetical protein
LRQPAVPPEPVSHASIDVDEATIPIATDFESRRKHAPVDKEHQIHPLTLPDVFFFRRLEEPAKNSFGSSKVGASKKSFKTS